MSIIGSSHSFWNIKLESSRKLCIYPGLFWDTSADGPMATMPLEKYLCGKVWEVLISQLQPRSSACLIYIWFQIRAWQFLLIYTSLPSAMNHMQLLKSLPWQSICLSKIISLYILSRFLHPGWWYLWSHVLADMFLHFFHLFNHICGACSSQDTMSGTSGMNQTWNPWDKDRVIQRGKDP